MLSSAATQLIDWEMELLVVVALEHQLKSVYLSKPKLTFYTHKTVLQKTVSNCAFYSL